MGSLQPQTSQPVSFLESLTLRDCPEPLPPSLAELDLEQGRNEVTGGGGGTEFAPQG